MLITIWTVLQNYCSWYQHFDKDRTQGDKNATSLMNNLSLRLYVQNLNGAETHVYCLECRKNGSGLIFFYQE